MSNALLNTFSQIFTVSSVILFWYFFSHTLVGVFDKKVKELNLNQDKLEVLFTLTFIVLTFAIFDVYLPY